MLMIAAEITEEWLLFHNLLLCWPIAFTNSRRRSPRLSASQRALRLPDHHSLATTRVLLREFLHRLQRCGAYVVLDAFAVGSGNSVAHA